MGSAGGRTKACLHCGNSARASSWDSSRPTASSVASRSRSKGSAPSGGPAPPDVRDLDPIYKDGSPVDWWVSAAQQKRAEGGEISGKLLESVPSDAYIGKGTWGVVWRAKDQAGSILAVKSVKVRKGDAASMRESELAQHLIQFPHPCIVVIHSVSYFRDVSLCCLVMEFCPCGSLLEHISRSRMDALARRADYVAPVHSKRWVAQVFLGLEHLHLNTGILFRDLKPDNVVLDKDNFAKLTDFGLGRVGTDSKGMTFGFPPGTVGYIAPELLRGERHDCKADIYSLGVLTWLILSGGISSKRAPQPPSAFATMRHEKDYRALFDDWRQLHDEAASWSGDTGELGPEVSSFVLAMVRCLPQDRLDHAGIRKHAFMADLSLPGRKQGGIAVEVWLLASIADSKDV